MSPFPVDETKESVVHESVTMLACSLPGRKLLFALATAACAALAAAADYPDAAELLRAVRHAQSAQKANLKGSLLAKPADASQRPVEANFRFKADGSVLRYEFSDPEPVTLRISLGEDDSELMQSGSSSGGQYSPAQFARRVMNTDLTYEDLALKFIYWRNARITGEDRMKTRPVWRVSLKPASSGRTAYGEVIAWVDKESGALMKAEGFNPAGRLIKRFEVVAAQVVKRAWFLKEMRVETIDPANGRAISRTTMEIEAPPE